MTYKNTQQLPIKSECADRNKGYSAWEQKSNVINYKMHDEIGISDSWAFEPNFSKFTPLWPTE